MTDHNQRAEDRKRAMRETAEVDPAHALLAMRRYLDGAILVMKREMVAHGLDRTHVCVVLANPLVDVREGHIAVRPEVIAREDIIRADTAPETQPVRDALANPPKEGCVWVLVPLYGARLLAEEPAELCFEPSQITNSPGGSA